MKIAKSSVTFILLINQLIIFSQSVKNVRFEQSGKQIIISYDLFSDDFKGNCSVDAYYTLDYGKTYISLKSVTGDAGSEISAGRNKKIVWNVLDDIYELSGEIKFKVVANPEKRYTFMDYDLFLSYGIVKNHLPYGGRIGLLGPNKLGGYFYFIYNYTQGTVYDSGGGSNYYDTEEYVIITGGPLLNIITENKFRLSIFAGGGYCDFTYSNPETDWSFISDPFFVIESGAILNFNHFNITIGLEKIDNLYLLAGIGFTL